MLLRFLTYETLNVQYTVIIVIRLDNLHLLVVGIYRMNTIFKLTSIPQV